jgi:pSer/pThr/pTyr-binding forkhead associated (FHA) protein
VSLDWILLGLRLLATIILYIFLGFAFYLIWRDLKQAQEQQSVVPPPRATDQLRVIAAAEGQPLVVGQTLPLQPAMLLGRGPENTIEVNDANALTTGQVRLSQKNGVWWLEDLDSENGTKLNHLPLSKPTPLSNGDIIEIGQVCFRLETTTK